MVEVFDVMAITGSSNARAMAAGISKATLPTMAGMVTSLSGIFFIAQIESKTRKAIANVEDELPISLGKKDKENIMRRRVRVEEESEINITPLLDIVFIMLIFFIVTATFVKESGIDVTRPDSETAQQQNRVGILIAISDKNEIWINRRMVDMDAVQANVEKLHAENPQGGAVLQADEKSEVGLMVQVIDAVRLAGVEQYSIAASEK